jgi:hypothetical protein
VYEVLSRPDEYDDGSSLSYYYKGGFDDPTTSATSNDERVVDLGAIDVKAVIAVLRGVPAAVGLKPGDIKGENTYLSIDGTRDPKTAGELTLRASVSSDFGSGSVTFGPDGTIKRVDPPT